MPYSNGLGELVDELIDDLKLKVNEQAALDDLVDEMCQRVSSKALSGAYDVGDEDDQIAKDAANQLLDEIKGERRHPLYKAVRKHRSEFYRILMFDQPTTSEILNELIES